MNRTKWTLLGVLLITTTASFAETHGGGMLRPLGSRSLPNVKLKNPYYLKAWAAAKVDRQNKQYYYEEETQSCFSVDHHGAISRADLAKCRVLPSRILGGKKCFEMYPTGLSEFRKDSLCKTLPSKITYKEGRCNEEWSSGFKEERSPDVCKVPPNSFVLKDGFCSEVWATGYQYPVEVEMCR